MCHLKCVRILHYIQDGSIPNSLSLLHHYCFGARLERPCKSGYPTRRKQNTKTGWNDHVKVVIPRGEVRSLEIETNALVCSITHHMHVLLVPVDMQTFLLCRKVGGTLFP